MTAQQVVVAAALLLLAPLHAAGAQEPGAEEPAPPEKVTPLRKTDLVRMLSGTTYTKIEVARIIRRSCLAFEPTDQDLEHFRTLGADSWVMEAIDGCVAATLAAAPDAVPPEEERGAGREPAPREGPPEPPQAAAGREERAAEGGGAPDEAPATPERAARAAGDEPAGPVALRLASDRLTVPVGERSTLAVEARRGEAAAPNVRLVLRGSGDLAGGGTDAVAVTDERGQAVFPVRVAAPAGEHELRIAAPGVDIQSEGRIIVVAVPGPPERASISPDPIPPPVNSEEAVRIRIRLADAAGNPVPERQVQLRGQGPGGPALAAATTDGSGSAEVVLRARAFAGLERLFVSVGGRQLATVPVSRRRPGEAGTRFVSGGDGRGEAGLVLPEPLVLQVREASGEPLARWPVRFRATNGSVRPEVTETDSAGRVRVQVVLGEPGRPTEVTATVGELERRAVFQPTRGGMTPSEFRAGLSEAARRLAAGDHAEAGKLYARLLEADPRSVDALVGHGRALELSGDQAGAAARYRAALQLAPERRDARYWLEGLPETEGPLSERS